MDTTAVSTQLPLSTQNGIYVRGVVISNRVDAFNRKDGSGLVVKVTHEIALQPGVVIWERYFDPKKDGDVVRLDGDKVTAFPSLPDFQFVTLRAIRFKSDGDKFIISNANLLSDSR